MFKKIAVFRCLTLFNSLFCMDETEVLLNELASQHVAGNGKNALHHAAINDNVKAILILLEENNNIFEQDVRGFTPLHWAVYKGHEDAVHALLFYKYFSKAVTIGDDNVLKSLSDLFNHTKALLEIKDQRQCTVLDWAIYRGQQYNTPSRKYIRSLFEQLHDAHNFSELDFYTQGLFRNAVNDHSPND